MPLPRQHMRKALGERTSPLPQLSAECGVEIEQMREEFSGEEPLGAPKD